MIKITAPAVPAEIDFADIDPRAISSAPSRKDPSFPIRLEGGELFTVVAPSEVVELARREGAGTMILGARVVGFEVLA